MDLELKLERPLRRHAFWSAIVMGLAYAVGEASLGQSSGGQLTDYRWFAPNAAVFRYT